MSCIPGTFSKIPGNAICDTCMKNTFSKIKAQDHCEDCPSGWITPKGSASCQPCTIGTFEKDEYTRCCLVRCFTSVVWFISLDMNWVIERLINDNRLSSYGAALLRYDQARRLVEFDQDGGLNFFDDPCTTKGCRGYKSTRAFKFISGYGSGSICRRLFLSVVHVLFLLLFVFYIC